MLAAHTALTETNAKLPTDKRINFRIGIHVGGVMVRAGDLFGDGVNIASRVIGGIAPSLELAEIERVKKKTDSLQAYDCYLRCRARSGTA